MTDQPTSIRFPYRADEGERVLNEIPFEELQVGQPVRSLCTNNSGRISELIADSRNGPEVHIEWIDGKTSSWWHYQLHTVAVLAHDTSSDS